MNPKTEYLDQHFKINPHQSSLGAPFLKEEIEMPLMMELEVVVMMNKHFSSINNRELITMKNILVMK